MPTKATTKKPVADYDDADKLALGKKIIKVTLITLAAIAIAAVSYRAIGAYLSENAE